MAFLVTTTPSVRPKNLCACPRPVHPNEAFQVGKWVPATPFSGAGGDRHAERERDSGHLEMLPLDVLSKEPWATKFLSKGVSIDWDGFGPKDRRTGAPQQGVQGWVNKSQRRTETFECPS